MDNTIKDCVHTPRKLEGAKNSKTFENYWNEEEVEKGVLNGSLIEVCFIKLAKMHICFIFLIKKFFWFCRVFSELIPKITKKLISQLQ